MMTAIDITFLVLWCTVGLLIKDIGDDKISSASNHKTVKRLKLISWAILINWLLVGIKLFVK